MHHGSVGVVFVILMIIGLAEANAYETARDRHVFQPEGCEFSVSFPDRPKLITEKSDHYTRQSALLDVRTSSLSAICTTFDKEGPLDFPDETLSLWGWSYAERNGIRLPEIEVKNTPIGKLVIIKGSGLKDNWAYIYKVHAYYGLTSRMTLIISAKTKFYPTRESKAFLRSITRP
ncbi:MAG: hypothetical protein R8K46_04475 [Mariprofundaceae bacterium]